MQKLFDGFTNLKISIFSDKNTGNSTTRSERHDNQTVDLPVTSSERKTDNVEEVSINPSSFFERNVTIPCTTNIDHSETSPQTQTLTKGHFYEDQLEIQPLEKDVEDPIADANNALFNSFIGAYQLPSGKILIGDNIGSGAFGDVYRGKWGNKLVALKKIDFAHTQQTLGLNKNAALEALSWEISRLSTVSHPNLVQFYGIYQHESGGATYLVTEFCEGGDLRKKLDKKENITWAKRWQWVLEISKALAYLHSKGVLHRDLKAENILLGRNGRAKLADLGVAQVDALLQESEAQVVARGLHDLQFIAPENANDPTLSTKATDIYAFGLVLLEIASRKEPYWNSGEPIEKSHIPDDCPKSLKELILACCDIDPKKRPSAEELVNRIEVLGAEFNPFHHVLIKACGQLETFTHSKSQEGLAYIAPFVTVRPVEESIEDYWEKWETSNKKREGVNPPLKLQDTFLNFLKAPGCSTLLLLGEAGLGKTLTTYLWADQLMHQWWSYINDPSIERPPYFPILIRPAVTNWKHRDLKGACSKIAKQYGLKKDLPMLVFVDGYDELQMDEPPVNLSEHLGLSECPNSKLIVTCRPKTVDDQNLHERFNFKGELQTYHFLPFSIDQLLGYLKEALSWEATTEEEYKETLKHSHSVREVMRNPFMLYLLRQSWKTLSQQPLNELNRWKIYEGFVKHAVTTQSSLLSSELQSSLVAEYTNLLQSFQTFASDVAFRACQKGGMTFNLQEAAQALNYPWVQLERFVREDARKQFAERKEKLSNNNAASDIRRALLEEEDFIAIMQRRRLQLEADLPLKKRGDSYAFSHKSLFEYFVAKRLLEIFDNKDDFISKEDLSSLIDKLVESDPKVLLFLDEGLKEMKNKKLTTASFVDALNRKVNPDTALMKINILLNAIGKVLNNQAAKYAEALEYYMLSLAVCEQVYGEVHTVVATAYDNIGEVLKNQGKHVEALEYLKESLAIYAEIYGEVHPSVATAYNKIGEVLKNQGKFEDALWPKGMRADAEQAYHRYTEALECYQKALDICEQVYGQIHPSVAISYNNIGNILHNQDRYVEAFEHLKHSLAIYKQIYGTIHPSIAISYINLAEVLKDQGKYVEAFEYLKHSLAIYEQVYDKAHPSVATVYDNIGLVLNSQGKHAEALEYLMKSLVIYKQVYGEVHPSVATAYKNIGLVLETQGKHAEALEYYFKNLAICKQVYGKVHLSVAIAYNNVVNLVFTQDVYADELLDELFPSRDKLDISMTVLDIYEQVLGKKHPAIASLSYRFRNLSLKRELRREEEELRKSERELRLEEEELRIEELRFEEEKLRK